MTKLRSRPLRSRPLRSNSKFFSRKTKDPKDTEEKLRSVENTRAKVKTLTAKVQRGELTEQEALKIRLALARAALSKESKGLVSPLDQAPSPPSQKKSSSNKSRP